MEIRFECECYERTLVVNAPSRYKHIKDKMVVDLDQYYDEWILYETEEAETMCLEEYMMYKLMDKYDIELQWSVEEA